MMMKTQRQTVTAMRANQEQPQAICLLLFVWEFWGCAYPQKNQIGYFLAGLVSTSQQYSSLLANLSLKGAEIPLFILSTLQSFVF